MAKQYTDEFKQQIVTLYNNGKPANEIKKEYDLHPSVFYSWVKKYNDSGSFKVKDNRSPEEEELLRLRKENKQLLMENDILKQAALIMGRKSK